MPDTQGLGHQLTVVFKLGFGGDDPLAQQIADEGVPLSDTKADKARSAVPPGKLSARDANYEKNAAAPYICANCQWDVRDGEDDYCMLVHGPYADGAIHPQDACRLFSAKETPFEEDDEEEETHRAPGATVMAMPDYTSGGSNSGANVDE